MMLLLTEVGHGLTAKFLNNVIISSFNNEIEYP